MRQLRGRIIQRRLSVCHSCLRHAQGGPESQRKLRHSHPPSFLPKARPRRTGVPTQVGTQRRNLFLTDLSVPPSATVEITYPFGKTQLQTIALIHNIFPLHALTILVYHPIVNAKIHRLAPGKSTMKCRYESIVKSRMCCNFRSKAYAIRP